MAAVRTPREKPAATLRIAAPADTAAPQNDWSGRVGALQALARSESVQRAVRFLSYGLLGILIGILLLVATATVPVLFGYHTYRVEGGSMAPSLEAGGVAVTKPTSPRALQVGDIIAWQSSTEGRPVLHRIVQITNEGGRRLFVTQGDQNRSPDPQPIALQGPGDRVVYSVPYAGYILSFAGSGLGRVVLIGAPLALLAAIYLKEVRGSAREEKGTEIEIGVPAAERQTVPPLQLVPATSLGADNRNLPVFLVQQLLRYRAAERRTERRQEEEQLVA